jgi:hypothetical protein
MPVKASRITFASLADVERQIACGHRECCLSESPTLLPRPGQRHPVSGLRVLAGDLPVRGRMRRQAVGGVEPERACDGQGPALPQG